MKTTLTSADPDGWYLCRNVTAGRSKLLWWDGECLKADLDGTRHSLTSFNEYKHLVLKEGTLTESDVAALNEELRTLQAELGKQKEKWRILDRDYGIRINERNSLQGKLEVCEKYAASFQKQCDDYLGELRKAREENATLQSQADSLLRQAEQLEAELSRLKSQPYELRRADSPDCEGVWQDKDGHIYKIRGAEISLYGSCGPYYYLGPIPVVVEQQPPKVVTIKCKEDGETCRAIPTKQGTYMILDADGRICDETDRTSWEEVQS